MNSISLSHLVAAAVLLISAFTSQIASAQAGNIYGREQTQSSGSVQEGVVLQVSLKQTEASWQARSVGASLGSATGYAIARNNANGSAAVLSSLLGGLVGERIANHASSDVAQEIIVQMTSGNNVQSVVTVVQPAPFDPISAGEAVLLIQTAGKVRVIKRQF